MPPRTRTPSMSKAIANGTTLAAEVEDREQRLERARALCLLYKEEDTMVLALAAAAAVDIRRSSMMGTRCRWDGLSLQCERAMGVRVFRLFGIRVCLRSWLGNVGPLRLIPAVFDISPGA